MTDKTSKRQKVKENLLRLLRRSGLHSAVIGRVFEQWETILRDIPEPKDYKIYKQDNAYVVNNYASDAGPNDFETAEEARAWVQVQHQIDKENFFARLSDRLFNSVLPIIESLTRPIQTNAPLPNNRRWAARLRVRDRIRRTLENQHENIELDHEGLRSVEDQLMMVFQYCAQAKSQDRGRIYEIGEDHIVRKLYGPEQQMDTNATP
jgi:hypothetical protein